MARGNRNAAEAILADLLAKDPDDAQAHFLKGHVELESGRIAEARACFARAVALDPSQAQFHAFLGYCQIEQNDRAGAQRSAETALALGPDDRMRDLVATVQSRLGLHQAAAATLLRAVEQGSKIPSIYFNLATSLKYCGQFADARRVLEQAIALDPNHIRARAALTMLRDATRNENQIAELTSLLGRSGNSAERMHIAHALATEYEALGDFEGAFRALERGKAGVRACIRYDFNDDKALFDSMHRAFDRQMPPRGHSDADPIFVVGMPRSGTTVVDRILSGHPGVESVGETMHVSGLLQGLAGRPSPQLVDPRDVVELVSHRDLPRIGPAYMERLPAHDRPRVIDKFPLNSLLAGFILTALPNARVICLVRGAMDTVVGNYRQLFEYVSSIYRYSLSLETVARYYVEFRRLADRWASLFPDRFLTVSYEQLVADPDGVSRHLFPFCGLTWHPDFARIENNPAPVTTASAVQVREPLNTRAIGRWRHYERHLDPAREILARAGFETDRKTSG